ncbi:SoxR reducing system RseC family protein [Candidatus Thiosymbion oneisti]|uniref:SoxR reducing system RseC family protein n=1 Tax=Candidatus Thiosymbion oneisti TaxID=589554 RepID=UPI0013FE0D38|nr:SoxR reducing system RseC family protein [Candidatus Thiosymbion oneisti]
MIEETGQVISVQGELAEVERQSRSGCGSCAVKGTCGTSLLARYLGPKRLLLRAHNTIGARPGEHVVIGLPEGTLLEASVLAYLVPLVAMIGGAVAGAFVAERLAPAYTQVLSAVTGLGGLAGALAWLVGFIRAKSLDERYRPRILRRLSIGPGASPRVSPRSLSATDERAP